MKALDEEPDQTLPSLVRLALFTGMRRSALRKASGVASTLFGSIPPSSQEGKGAVETEQAASRAGSKKKHVSPACFTISNYGLFLSML
ncbi:hypothetical protein [Desulfovibrio sp. ZJ369]|uniref:hypothetical protein n=1 Tax=Desulfovibrio sp. ZJ369 TaxID=2709793 RepID=UPI0013ED7E5A|nr:hypothetical protein [Desulfovibrio sp. ZJ369]